MAADALRRLPDAPTLTRRGFVAAAGGVLFAFTVPAWLGSDRAAATTTPTRITAWITIQSDNTVTIQVGSTEMGQGVLTSLSQIVAEELCADFATVHAQHSPASTTFGNPAYGNQQVTGGSYSVRGYYPSLRVVGATVRTMLIKAAANAWKINVSRCVAAHNVVTDSTTGRTMTYAQLAAAAARIAPPTNPVLLDPSQFQLIGTSVPRTDIPSKVNGSAKYAPDIRMAGMQYAVIKHCPTLGSTVASIGTPPAGTTVVNLTTAVAVIATTWWAAFQGAGQLQVTWNTPASSAQLDSAYILSQANALMANPPANMATAESSGDAPAAISAATSTINVSYDVPYLVHACLEPVTCTALVTSTSCKLWASTQVQTNAVAVAAQLTGLPTSAITLTTPMLGGGLGRKLETDFIDQAIRIAQTKPGVAIQLMWPRREDFANDLFRPMALTNVQAGLDSSGNVVGWWNRIVTPSILAQKGYLSGPVDDQSVEGAVTQPYTWANRLVEWVPHPAAVPIGFWRSVGHSFNAFAVESAMDELAALTPLDPVAFRLSQLPAGGRHAAVLNGAAALAGWPSAPSGHALGVALHEAMGSIVALVAEVSQPSPGQIKVHTMSCAIDCGMAVNPDGVKAQMEGGIVHGMNAALFGKLTLTQGVVSPTNFDFFRMMRIKDMPQVNVTIINSGAALGGVGEPGSPPVAPAIANAWFALTGNRLRSLPMF